MKKYLLPESGNFYKANLHCHSTFSDGKHTPEEIKKAYMDKGYSIRPKKPSKKPPFWLLLLKMFVFCRGDSRIAR